MDPGSTFDLYLFLCVSFVSRSGAVVGYLLRGPAFDGTTGGGSFFIGSGSYLDQMVGFT